VLIGLRDLSLMSEFDSKLILLEEYTQVHLVLHSINMFLQCHKDFSFVSLMIFELIFSDDILNRLS